MTADPARGPTIHRRSVPNQTPNEGLWRRRARVTFPEVAAALNAAGYARSHRYLRAVLSGEKRSRPALREISAAVDAVHRQRRVGLPDGL
ncbi:MAG: hypothetical protein AAFQ43_15090 [Bacteroidota bacterium]